jgi:hypothetical protein
MEGNELRDKLNGMLLNTKELATILNINYYDLVRFLNGKTTNLSGPALKKVNEYFSKTKKK